MGEPPIEIASTPGPKPELEPDLDHELRVTQDWCGNLHDAFDRDVWRKKSFHNRVHIESFDDALVALAEKEDGKLMIQEQLDHWNEQHPDHQYTPDETIFCLRFMAAVHDTGDIAESVHYDKGTGTITTTPRARYQAKGSEEQSNAVASCLLQKANLLQYQPLINHLIDQTKYIHIPNEEQKRTLFAKLVTACDQVGTHLFSKQHRLERIDGLLLEQSSEKEQEKIAMSINPYNYYNFACDRLDVLMEKQKKQEETKRILDIWGKPLLEKFPESSFPNKQMSASEFLAMRERQGNAI